MIENISLFSAMFGSSSFIPRNLSSVFSSVVSLGLDSSIIGLFLAATISSISWQSGQEFVLFKVLFRRVSVQGVESLWGDCRFIPADWGS